MKRLFPLLFALSCGGRAEAEPASLIPFRPADQTEAGNSGDRVGSKDPIVQIAAKGDLTCALGASGTIRCWDSHFSAAEVGREPSAVQLAVRGPWSMSDYKSVYARLEDGRVVAYRGHGTAAPGQQVAGLANVVQLSAGGAHVCAVVRGGSVWCWGDNTLGQMGSGFSGGLFGSPNPVPGLGGVVEISAGEFSTCARDGDGSVKCWGSAYGGQLGDNSPENAHVDCPDRTIACSAKPVTVFGLSDATALTSGLNWTCAERRTGAPVCWGADSNGHRADGTQIDRTRPEPTLFGAGTSMSAAYDQICGVFENVLGCTAPGGVDMVVRRLGGSDLGQVKTAAGGWHSMCALLVDGQVRCWSKSDVWPPTFVTVEL